MQTEEKIETAIEWRGNLLTMDARYRYITGGKATFTIQSLETATRFTYRMTKKEFDGKVFYFLSVLVGPDNWNNYKYAGIFDPITMQLRTSQKSKIAITAPSLVAFQWAMAHLDGNKFEFWHEGSCGVCGRKLTVPESIASGIGPICAAR